MLQDFEDWLDDLVITLQEFEFVFLCSLLGIGFGILVLVWVL